MRVHARMPNFEYNIVAPSDNNEYSRYCNIEQDLILNCPRKITVQYFAFCLTLGIQNQRTEIVEVEADGIVVGIFSIAGSFKKRRDPKTRPEEGELKK